MRTRVRAHPQECDLGVFRIWCSLLWIAAAIKESLWSTGDSQSFFCCIATKKVRNHLQRECTRVHTHAHTPSRARWPHYFLVVLLKVQFSCCLAGSWAQALKLRWWALIFLFHLLAVAAFLPVSVTLLPPRPALSASAFASLCLHWGYFQPSSSVSEWSHIIPVWPLESLISGAETGDLFCALNGGSTRSYWHG